MHVSEIKKNRIDLTKYLTHFIHKTEVSSSFEVLKKIVRSGVIKSSWAERNNKRTIFGKKPAVCFTELPLFALIDYVLVRNNPYNVDLYGIAFLKSEMYRRFKARPIIYGTTNSYEEICDKDGNYYLNGIDFPQEELYRYMLTSIDTINDWTHEREWRWCDPDNRSKLQGFPVWKNSTYQEKFKGDNFFNYQAIIIILKTQDEANEIIKLFRKKTDFIKHNKSNIENTYIHVIEEEQQKKCEIDKANYTRLDDFSLRNLINIGNELGFE